MSGTLEAARLPSLPEALDGMLDEFLSTHSDWDGSAWHTGSQVSNFRLEGWPPCGGAASALLPGSHAADKAASDPVVEPGLLQLYCKCSRNWAACNAIDGQLRPQLFQ